MRHLVRSIASDGIAKAVQAPDPDILFPFETKALTDGRLAA
jgi:hypothetical protein